MLNYLNSGGEGRAEGGVGGGWAGFGADQTTNSKTMEYIDHMKKWLIF